MIVRLRTVRGVRLSTRPPPRDTVVLIVRAADAMRRHLTEAALTEHGLTWRGFVVLWAACEHPGIETRALAELADVSKGTLTGVVTTLERRGFVDRVGDHADRRLVHVHPTAAGQALVRAVLPAVEAAERDLVAGLSARESAALTTGLQRLLGQSTPS
jgi:DNA-binding MarR family transcriptional regulator